MKSATYVQIQINSLCYSLPQGLPDVSSYPALYEELISRGWTEENLQKLSGRNLIRVFRQAEKV